MKENRLNLKGRYLVTTRRIVQILTFILFLFLLLNTGRLIRHDIPVLNYLFFASTGLLLFFGILKLIRKALWNKQKVIVYFVILALTLILGIFLLANNQFSSPDYAVYLENHPDETPETLRTEFLQELEDTNKFNELTHISTETKESGDKPHMFIQLTIPPVLILLNYLLLLVFGFMVVYSIRKLIYSLKDKTQFKRRFAVVIYIILFLITFLSFAFLEGEAKNPDEYEVASSLFPADFENVNYSFKIPTNLFLKLSPFIGTIAGIASRELVIGLGFTLFFVIITLIFGRVFCGWFCPLGTANHFVSYLKMKYNKRFEREKYTKKQHIKYVIMFVVLISALFTLDLAGFFDPISLITKFFAVTIIPAMQFVVNSTYDLISLIDENIFRAENESQGGLLVFAGSVKDYLTEYFLYSGEIKEGTNLPTHFSYYILNGLIVVTILGLNLKLTRFWCRVLCPLGAMLGTIGKRSLFRLTLNKAACTHCRRCETFCQGPSDIHVEDNFKNNECLYCFHCINTCPEGAIDITFLPKSKSLESDEASLDISKRDLLKASGYAAGVLLLMRTSTFSSRNSTKLIRPPGAVEESEFLSKCVKCGECMKACPQNFLHPAFLESGAEGMFTPIVNPQKGYCQYDCNVCGDVCPTQAIQKLALPEKQKTVIALARVNHDTCLTYATNTPCLVCEEHCPTSPKAIYTEDVVTKKRNGEEYVISQIKVDPKECIGCGICVYVCPVTDKPGIYIYPAQETRHPDKKIYLEE